ncbi:hypothetical protein AB0K48_19560, partial [Nonomuraea sp. NPDC055795]
MAGDVRVWINWKGVVSTGDGAVNIVQEIVQAPPPVPAARVPAPPGVVPSRSAARGARRARHQPAP